MSSKFGPQDKRVAKAELDVWLGRDMAFNTPPGQNIKRYSKYTQCKKVEYTSKILDYLDRMEDVLFPVEHDHNGRACAIKLDGVVRYVWRSDLLNEEEYGREQEKHRSGIRDLRKK